MPNRHNRNRRMVQGRGDEAGAEASAGQEQPPQPGRIKQTGRRAWLRDAFFSGPPPSRWRRWELLRALRRELDE